MSDTPNTSILEGVSCPRCGHTDQFWIESTTCVTVTDDGAEAHDLEWDDEAATHCCGCGYDGPMSEFTAPGPGFTLDEIREYFKGWRITAATKRDGPSYAVLHNALLMLGDDQDGIFARRLRNQQTDTPT